MTQHHNALKTVYLYIAAPGMVALILLFTPPAFGKTITNLDDAPRMQIDQTHVKNWNKFADDLFTLHQHNIKNRSVSKTEIVDGYSNLPKFYKEVTYRDNANNNILSRIRWELKPPHHIHTIEVYIYDNDGKIKRDYLAAFLPKFRNAPVQTLINFHYNEGATQAFRQFDASGNRIYEQCNTKINAKQVFISLEEEHIPDIGGTLPDDVNEKAYLSCFNQLPPLAKNHLVPLNEIGGVARSNKQASPFNGNDIDSQIARLDTQITASPDNAQLYLIRGNSHFLAENFQLAIDDFTQALKRDDSLDDAYFWRGMALGRQGNVQNGIKDLSVFIDRNPNHSRAYTKRGVRYIWIKEFAKAQQDLETAIELDPKNAEAHDDLGVIYAQQGKVDLAIKHFRLTIESDPSYHKAYHNLATAHYLIQKYDPALSYVNKSLQLEPNSKNTVLLKVEILKSLGDIQTAAALQQRADKMHDGNWSEEFTK